MSTPSCVCHSVVATQFHYHDFFSNDTTPTEIYTLSLHDALPILSLMTSTNTLSGVSGVTCWTSTTRSEEHTSELQSHVNLVCRLLLEKKNIFPIVIYIY